MLAWRSMMQNERDISDLLCEFGIRGSRRLHLSNNKYPSRAGCRSETLLYQSLEKQCKNKFFLNLYL